MVCAVGYVGMCSRPLIGRPIRGLVKIQHEHWIPGKILPHFDPSYLSVSQITRKLGFLASHLSAIGGGGGGGL